MEDRYGLTQLYAPPTGTKVTAHVVFVHGLFGHPRKTWSAKVPHSKSSEPAQSRDEPPHTQKQHGAKGSRNGYICWPETLLPSVIPDARILTFGFDADVDGFLSSASQNTIHQHAQNLLSDLADLRDTPKDQAIPIIFVVHSLGGIVVKDALNQSSSTVGTRLKEICPAVIGICFLGTPHRGSKTASMGKMAYNATVIVSKRPNLGLLQALERNSEILDRVGDTFSQTLMKHDIAIYSFREEKETRKLIFSTMVVNADSAKIGDGKEEIGSIPANHSHMTKFESATDVGFKRVSAQLRRWVEKTRTLDVTPTQDREDCMNSLNDRVTRARIYEVSEAHKKTFHWLFDPQVVSFTRWLRGTDESKSPIYWIQGKPGSGKSTLMKFAMRDTRLLEILNADTGDAWILAAFFFHDRGSEMQKALVGMLQEILRSVLDQIPALLPFLVPSYLDLVHEQRTRSPIWDLNHLSLAFRSIFEQREVHVRILFFLDALDEHYGDNESLISLLKELNETTDNDYVAIKWCLASRSWTVFEQHFGGCPGFSIHDYTKQDIRTYVESQLEVNSCGQYSPPDQDRLAALIDTVTRKALGIFIWVRIVVDRLSKGIRDGTPYATLETMVEEMPQKLSELYADTLRRVEPEYATEAYIMLQTAFCSVRPLPLQSFMASLDYNYKILKQPDPYRRHFGKNPSFTPPHEDLGQELRRLASRSGGLLETVSHPAQDEEASGTPTLFIQFIHQTVKEYVQLRQDHLGLVGVPPSVMQENGNCFLLRSCEVSNDERVCCIKKDLFVYAKFAEDTVAAVDIVFPEPWLRERNRGRLRLTTPLINKTFASRGKFDLQWWLKQQQGPLYEAILRGFPSHNVEIVVILGFGLAVAANLLHYINDTAPEGLNIGSLCIAAAGPDINTGSRKIRVNRMIKDLLVHWPVDRGLDTPYDGIWSNWLGTALNSPNPGGFRNFWPSIQPLQWMIEAGQTFSDRNEETRLSIARTLIQSGTVYAYPSESGKNRILELCIRHESAAWVRLLLQYGADPNPKASEPWHIFRYAYIRQDAEILRALHDFGIDSTSSTYDIAIEESVQGRLLHGGMMLAASCGGVPAALVLSGSRKGRESLMPSRNVGISAGAGPSQ